MFVGFGTIIFVILALAFLDIRKRRGIDAREGGLR
jgi:hypothetical protein